jgi:hypothetical protein
MSKSNQRHDEEYIAQYLQTKKSTMLFDKLREGEKTGPLHLLIVHI